MIIDTLKLYVKKNRKKFVEVKNIEKNMQKKFERNSILCTKGVKWTFLDQVWSLQYVSKASKHEPKPSAFCESKTSTITTRG